MHIILILNALRRGWYIIQMFSLHTQLDDGTLVTLMCWCLLFDDLDERVETSKILSETFLWEGKYWYWTYSQVTRLSTCRTPPRPPPPSFYASSSSPPPSSPSCHSRQRHRTWRKLELFSHQWQWCHSQCHTQIKEQDELQLFGDIVDCLMLFLTGLTHSAIHFNLSRFLMKISISKNFD